MQKSAHLDGKQLTICINERNISRKPKSNKNGPRLKEAHCLRDALTKLNVHPAKIMQVSY